MKEREFTFLAFSPPSPSSVTTATATGTSKLCARFTLFWKFFCPPCTTTTWNYQILRLLENWDGKVINSIIPLWTWERFFFFSSNRNSFLFSNRMTWDNRGIVWKAEKSIFQGRFHGRRRCRIASSVLPAGDKIDWNNKINTQNSWRTQ